ncbi:MAG TPA: Rne/Rng family ribonuclease [Polyangiaceae bacterium]|nr:Rne/Rng family ribonuclease [Polyangiaceae bacterium]
MAKNILVISCDVTETRVALIENGIIAELHIERRGSQPRGGTVGDIYLGKVTRVLPGLQAAFVDIGLERAAFLHVEDLIRPDDFEAYLAGGRKHASGGGGGNGQSHDAGEGMDLAAAEAEEAGAGDAAAASGEPGDHAEDARAAIEAAAHEAVEAESAGDVEPSEADAVAVAEAFEEAAAEDPDAEDAEAEDAETEDPDAEDAEAEAGAPREEVAHADAETHDRATVEVEAPDDWDDAADEGSAQAGAGEGTSAQAEEDKPTRPQVEDPESDRPPPMPVKAAAMAGGGDDLDDLLDNPNLPGFTISDPGAPAPMPRAPAPRLEGARDGRGGGGRGRRRGRVRGRGGREPAPRDSGPQRRETRDAGHRDGQRDHRSRSGPAAGRLSKSTPIRDVVKEGQEIIVQITKEPIGTKGARCSSHVSLPGRYVVYLPTLDHVGVSKRIGSEKERARLRETIESMKPPSGGLIVRTVAEGLTKKQLKQDVGYLVHLWGEVAKKHEDAKAPALLVSELDIVLKTARDLFTDDVDEIVIDDRAQYERLSRFVEMFMPERAKEIVHYSDDEPIFDAYGIEDEIARALSRKVPLPSGGYLIIDEAEALTAIDVNTGRFVGKGSKDMEETILKTNLEAVQEIAYQLRFRNIGGLIILDLIDMEKLSNREKVRKTLDEILQKDKAKTTLNRISELGLIEMTRKRTRESLGRLLHEPCFYCDGTGHLQSKETIAYDILREIRRKRQDLPGYSILVNCHPAVADLLTGTERSALQDAESRYMRRIQINARTEYHLEQFDLSGR